MKNPVRTSMPQMRREARPALIGLVSVAMVGALASLAPIEVNATTDTGADAGRAARPNIVLIMTDDQNRPDLRWMPKTRRLLGGHGVTFTSALSPDPLCCPARAEFVSGQLGQNNGVRSNVGPRGGFHGLLHRQNTLGRWLQAAGYQTAMVGRYLNGYARRHGRQSGWTIWNAAMAGEFSYTNTTFFGDGHPVHYSTNVTKVISRYTVRYIHRFARSGHPFFIWSSQLAPHGRLMPDGHFTPPLPTARHRGDLRSVPSRALSKPSFEALGTRPWPYPGLFHKVGRAYAQQEFTRRIESLRDVDDAVARVLAALRETGQRGNTYVILVSDNANLMGEHGIDGKDVLYREALEIPMVVRVPRDGRNRHSSLPATPTDVTATIVDLAGATAGRRLDGRSLVPVLRGRGMRLRDTQLIQTGNLSGRWAFRGVWTRRYTYFRRLSDATSFLYDHRVAPYELVNAATSPRYRAVLAELQRRTARLHDCAGSSCSRTFGPLPRPR